MFRSLRFLVVLSLSSAIAEPARAAFATRDGASMITPRAYHTATRLQDGTVLMAGGFGTRGPLAAAELYDPATATFRAVGSLRNARWRHTATLLPDGRVLVAGGVGVGAQVLATAEVYEPSTRAFRTVFPMKEARHSHAAVLVDGRVAIAGGASNGVIRDSVEVFDAATGSFALAGQLPETRLGPSAIALPGRRILVIGGETNRFSGSDFDPPVSSRFVWPAVIFDLDRGTSSTLAQLLNAPARHTATVAGNGRVLIDPFLQVVHPVSGDTHTVGGPPDHREGRSAVAVPNGDVLLCGGVTRLFLALCGVYRSQSDQFQDAIGNLGHARAGHSATLLADGSVLIAGGVAENGLVAVSEKVTWP